MSHDEKFKGEEKRRAPRIRAALVQYSMEGPAAPKKDAFIKDICIHGVCIYLHENIKPKTIIYLDVFLFGSNNPLSAAGQVAWTKPGEYEGYHNLGIEFTRMGDEDQKALAKAIDQAQENAI